MSSETAPLLVDDKYKVVSALGGGSFSEVYVVQDAKGASGRSALKLLRKGSGRDSSSEVVQDFKHEFEILKDLTHPNIARILDFGYDPRLRQYYYTTELIEGQGLFEATEGKSCAEILEYFVQALRAFQYLHSYQVHHFDVKSANVLLTKDGIVKVIDFGLASIDPGGRMIGTPAYMAPEIIAKERPDGRADLYSLGVLFYACFTRQNPFRAKSVPDTLKNHQILVPSPASSLREDLPVFLNAVLTKLLEKNPANRYQRADEALREINFYSLKKFELETRETLLSYLPEEGRLIGRRREVELFRRLSKLVFEPPSPRSHALALIEGDPGTGKTRLLKEFKYDAQLRGMNVVSASVLAREEASVWLDTFRKHAAEGRPTVFLLDDLDAWSETDEGFLQFRAAMARLIFQEAVDRLPFLWVGSLQSSSSLPSSLKDLWSGESLETIRLGSFVSEELREYVTALTGLEDPPQALLSGLEARTDGNPRLVTELLRSLIEEGALFDPAGRWKKTTFEDLGVDFSKAHFSGVLEELLYARFEKLEIELRRVLEALAVGNRLRAAELERLTEDVDLTRRMEDLLARDLVTRDPSGRYQIKNTTLSDLILQRLGADRRYELHDRAAGLFREGSEQRIFHEIRGRDTRRAYALCRETAGHYLREARGHDAAELLEFARGLNVEKSLDEDIGILLKIGEAFLIALDYPHALKAFGNAEDILSEHKSEIADIHLQVDALLRIGGVYLKMNEIEKSRGSLTAALALLHYMKGDRSRELVAENLRGAILLQEGKIDEAKRLFERTLGRWEKELTPDERKKVTNNDLGLVYLLSRQYPEALKRFRADLEFFQGLGDRVLLARTHYHLGQTCAAMGDFSAAVEHDQICVSLAQPLKNTELMLRAYNDLGNAFNVMKRPEEAIRYYERGLDLCERTGDLRSHAAILVNIGIIQASQAHYDKALRSLDPAVAYLKTLKSRFAIDRQVMVRALLEMGDVALKQKQWKASEDRLREALTLAEEGEGVPELRFWIFYALGELFLAKGDAEALRRILPEIKKCAQSAEEKERAAEISVKEKSIGERDGKDPTLSEPVRPKARRGRMKDPYQYILEINKFINAESDLSFVLKSVLNYALELSQAESGAILLVDDKGGLGIAVSRNLDEKDPISEVSRGVARRAITSGNHILSDNAVDDPSLGSEASVVRLDLKSLLCIPIKSKNRVIGALYLDNRLLSGAFEHADIDVLKAFADQAGIAIQNARLLNAQEASRLSLEKQMSEISSQLEHYQTLVHASDGSLDTKYDYKNIIARSKPMVEVFRLLDKITDTDLTVFIHGESGTGKELIARALHVNGRRNKKRFVAINCGAIPQNLIESELFGYKAGAFTGAARDKKGLFEEADGGTIFLDEMGELEMPLQAKLLRVVQEGEFYRVGDTQPVKCDVRVVSASNKDLHLLTKEGKFREDLYYRLCQIRIDLPPLKERREDIPLLVDHFIKEEKGKSMKVSNRLLKAFLEYNWPGNIRELENLVKVAVALADGDSIDANAIPANYGISKFMAESTSASPRAPQIPPSKEKFPEIDSKNDFDPSKSWYDYERVIIAKAYQKNDFRAKETAEMLGIAPATLYKKIRENGLGERDHVLYADPFRYESGKALRDYLKPVFEAALAYSNNKPYKAIAQLKVSQGYFYNVIKGKV